MLSLKPFRYVDFELLYADRRIDKYMDTIEIFRIPYLYNYEYVKNNRVIYFKFIYARLQILHSYTQRKYHKRKKNIL